VNGSPQVSSKCLSLLQNKLRKLRVGEKEFPKHKYFAQFLTVIFVNIKIFFGLQIYCFALIIPNCIYKNIWTYFPSLWFAENWKCCTQRKPKQY